MPDQSSVLSAPARNLRRRWQRTGWSSELAGLIAFTVVLAVLIVVFPEVTPLMSLVLPLTIASLVLGPRALPWFVVFVLLVLAMTVTQRPNLDTRSAMTVVVLFTLGFIILMASFRRSRLGVAGVRGESMLVDLRDRILKQGTIPNLPEDWLATWELRAAGGTLFAGDFVVASRAERSRLDVVVVDVSGKGEQAGTRALLLSGAFGGLMGALPPDEFLPAANDYLLRQDWGEGFATAVHLTVNLDTGDYEVRSAGHPPAAFHDAGTGRWSVLESEGTVLGLVQGAEFPVSSGTMRPGDAVLLYTDGLVETRGVDIALGIDRMLGQAERVMRGDFENGTGRLVEALGAPDDDCGLLMIHRRVI